MDPDLFLGFVAVNIIWGQWCVRILRRIFLDLMFFNILLCANCNFCMPFTKRWIKRTKNKKKTTGHRTLMPYLISQPLTYKHAVEGSKIVESFSSDIETCWTDMLSSGPAGLFTEPGVRALGLCRLIQVRNYQSSALSDHNQRKTLP